MKVLNELTKKPEESEGEIFRVWQSGLRVVQKCWKGVDDISDRGWNLILFWLNSSNPEKAESTPFRLTTQDKTVDKYIHTFEKFNSGRSTRQLSKRKTHSVRKISSSP